MNHRIFGFMFSAVILGTPLTYAVADGETTDRSQAGTPVEAGEESLAGSDAPSRQRIEALIGQLGEADEKTRDKAEQELLKAGKSALPALRNARKRDGEKTGARLASLITRIEYELKSKVDKLFNPIPGVRRNYWKFPNLTWDDIPDLMRYVESTRQSRFVPSNPISSIAQFEGEREGIVAAWLIDGIIAGGRFPSLNPDLSDSEGKEVKVKDVAKYYQAWWKKAKDMKPEESREHRPLAASGFHWYGGHLAFFHSKVQKLFNPIPGVTPDYGKFPDLTWDDIPDLIIYVGSPRQSRYLPSNPVSSRLQRSQPEGIVAAWLIEGIIAGGRFPSLNPILYDSESKEVKDVAKYYQAWWKEAKDMKPEEARKHPRLDTTKFRWY